MLITYDISSTCPHISLYNPSSCTSIHHLVCVRIDYVTQQGITPGQAKYIVFPQTAYICWKHWLNKLKWRHMWLCHQKISFCMLERLDHWSEWGPEKNITLKSGDRKRIVISKEIYPVHILRFTIIFWSWFWE